MKNDKTKNIKIKNAISLALNIVNALLVFAAVGWFFTEKGLESGAGNMQSGGTGCFCFFTIDSNILAAICGLVIVPFNIKAIKSGNEEIKKWAIILKMVGTTAVTVTFIVVLFFLGPIMGYGTMFEGNCFQLHLVCPVISIISFCFFENCSGKKEQGMKTNMKINKKQAMLGVLPTLIYGSVYLTNVIFIKKWEDFYHFNIGGFWYISLPVMLLVTYLLAFLLCLLRNKMAQKSQETR